MSERVNDLRYFHAEGPWMNGLAGGPFLTINPHLSSAQRSLHTAYNTPRQALEAALETIVLQGKIEITIIICGSPPVNSVNTPYYSAERTVLYVHKDFP